jgi:3-oxoacyl-[acyl-carrier protein] reductase
MVPNTQVKFDFTGRTVFVAAASKGIGFAIASLFAESGAQVAFCSRDADHLEKARKKLVALAPENRVLALVGDVSDSAFIRDLPERIEQAFATKVDTLVTNAGGPPPKRLADTDESDWEKAIDTNLLSVIRLARTFLPAMVEGRFGRLIHLTSLLAREPKPGMGLSNVTRAGVTAFSKTLATEAGPQGITSNTILTGAVRTERFEHLLEQRLKSTGESREQAMEKILATIPSGTVAEPRAIANLVAFLAAKESGYLNGAALPFDGGSGQSLF